MKIKYEILSKIEIYSTTGELIGRAEIHFDNPTNLHISSPIGNTGLKILQVGEPINVIYNAETRGYKFRTKVTSRYVDGIKLFVIHKPENESDYVIIQRRGTVRVEKSLPIKYVKITKEELQEFRDSEISQAMVKMKFVDRLFDGRTYDLSAGGIGIHIRAVRVERLENFILLLENRDIYEIIICDAVKIISDNKNDYSEHEKFYKLGLRILGGTKGLEDKLFEYIFKLMREQSHIKRQDE